MLTPWGYEVEELPPLITAEQFNAITGDQYADDPRLDTAIAEVSGLVRMACRWHIAPSVECEYTTGGDGRVIQLPALAVSGVSSVSEFGQELAAGQYEWRREGLLRRCGFRAWPKAWNSVQATYTAGFAEVPAEIMGICVSRILATVSLPVGVRSESAGGVSVTYGDSGDLSAVEVMALTPYALPVEV